MPNDDGRSREARRESYILQVLMKPVTSFAEATEPLGSRRNRIKHCASEQSFAAFLSSEREPNNGAVNNIIVYDDIVEPGHMEK